MAFRASLQEIQTLPSKAENLRILQQSRPETTPLSMIRLNKDLVFSKSRCTILTNSKADSHLRQMQTVRLTTWTSEAVSKANLLPIKP